MGIVAFLRFNIIPESGPPPPKWSATLAIITLVTLGAIVALIGHKLGAW